MFYISVASVVYLGVGLWLFFRVPPFRGYSGFSSPGEPYSLAVVFSGDAERIPRAIELMRMEKAEKLLVSPASEEEMQYWLNKYAGGEKISCILETRARSTHENASFCRDIILNKNARSVLLITSFYHMPRSHRLLALALNDRGVLLDCYPVDRGKWNGGNWHQNPEFYFIFLAEWLKTLMSFSKFLLDGFQIK